MQFNEIFRKSSVWIRRHPIFSLSALLSAVFSIRAILFLTNNSQNNGIFLLFEMLLKYFFWLSLIFLLTPIVMALTIGLKEIYRSFAKTKLTIAASAIWVFYSFLVLFVGYIAIESGRVKARFPVTPLFKSIYAAEDYASAKGVWVYQTQPLEDAYMAKKMPSVDNHIPKSVSIECIKSERSCHAIYIITLTGQQHIEERDFQIESWSDSVVVFGQKTRCQDESYALDGKRDTLNGKTIYSHDLKSCPENKDLFGMLPYYSRVAEVNWIGSLESGNDVQQRYNRDAYSPLAKAFLAAMN